MILKEGHFYKSFSLSSKDGKREKRFIIDSIPEHNIHHKVMENKPIYNCDNDCSCLCDHCIIRRVDRRVNNGNNNTE